MSIDQKAFDMHRLVRSLAEILDEQSVTLEEAQAALKDAKTISGYNRLEASLKRSATSPDLSKDEETVVGNESVTFNRRLNAQNKKQANLSTNYSLGTWTTSASENGEPKSIAELCLGRASTQAIDQLITASTTKPMKTDKTDVLLLVAHRAITAVTTRFEELDQDLNSGYGKHVGPLLEAQTAVIRALIYEVDDAGVARTPDWSSTRTIISFELDERVRPIVRLPKMPPATSTQESSLPSVEIPISSKLDGLVEAGAVRVGGKRRMVWTDPEPESNPELPSGWLIGP